MKAVRMTMVALSLATSGLVRATEPTLGGEFTSLKGPATVTQSGQTVKLYPGASVIVGDRLHTGKGTRLKLRMIDGAEIMLGENTEFIVREYELHETVGRAALELTKGFFRAVTGRIAKLRDSTFQVKTPLAIVGVRGTDFWGEQHPNRLRIALLSGPGTSVVISNDAGSVELNEAGYGTEVTSSTAPPKPPFRWSPAELQRAAGTVN
jgi:ferric-dicitrate binding protein FerR (iron transport regulator)